MYKIITLSVFLLCTTLLTAQVGIGTTDPAAGAMLDIHSDNSGIVIPRVALTATNLQAPITAPSPEIGLMVFNTATAGTAPNNVTPGFYFWNGSGWVRLASGASTDWALTGNAGTDPNVNFIGTTSNVDFRVRTNSAERFNFTSNGRLRAYDNGTAGQPTYSWNGNTNTGFFRPAANALAFSTNGVERMRIDANGIVGIGSTTPSTSAIGNIHRLNVQGAATSSGTTFTHMALLLNTGSGASLGIINENTANNFPVLNVGSFGPNGTAIRGLHLANTGNGFGVFGVSNSATGGVGVRGQGLYAVEGIGAAEGVYGQALYGVVGVTTDLVDGWAGYFEGDVGVSNDLYVFGEVFEISDSRIKKNFRNISNALVTINALKPTVYEKNISIIRNKYDEKNAQTLSLNNSEVNNQRISNPNKSNDKTEYGLIAQEVELILPNLVNKKKMNIEGLGEIDLKSVNYTGLIPILIQGIQEQQEIIESQEERIAKLEALVNQLINKK